MAANNKQIENRVKQLMAIGIAYPQAVAIANSEIPTMQPGGKNMFSNFLQNLDTESYKLDKDYSDLQWSQGMFEWGKESEEQSKKLDQQDGLDLNTEELKKLFNPYAGYSMEDALMGMGRFIGGDRSFGNALGFIKAPIAGARTFMSGMGLARREKDAREKYEEEQRREMVDNRREGGVISNDFLSLIESLQTNKLNEKGLPVNENKDRMYQNVHDIFYKVNTELRPPTFQTGGMPLYRNMSTYEDFLNMKRQEPKDGILKSHERDSYERDNRRMIDEATDIYNLTRNPVSPEIIEKYREYKKYNDSVNNVIKKRIEEGHIYEDGGSLTFPERMTGEYLQGVPENMQDQAVVEVEDGEHILQPDGTMSEVRGNKHSQGGEKLTANQIQDGTIVVSDHLKIGRENAKYFNKAYDIKVKASDTYATVIDKIKSKVGLDKINKEQEKLIEEVQKQERSTKDVNTKNINLEFLSEKINQLEQEKQSLEEVVKQALVDVYNVQESEKSPEERAPVIDQNLVNQTAQQYNIPEEQAMGIVQEYLKGGQIPKMQDGRMYNIYGKDMIMTSNGLVQKIPGAEGSYNPNITQEFWKDTKNLPQISQEIGIEAFLEDFENKRFIKGEPYNESEMKEIQEEIERRIAMIDNLDTSIVNKNVLKDMLQQSVEQAGIIQGQAITNEEQGTEDSNEIEEDTTQTTDTSVDKEEATQERRTPVSTVNSGLPFTKPNTEINTKPALEDLQRLADSLPEVEGKEDKSKVDTGTERVTRNNPDFFQFPDQSVSPPDSIRPPLKGTVRLGRADAYRIDPAQALAQNQRNFDAQMAQIGNLPPAQRAAAQAALLAEKNSADNQVINMASMQNAQIEAETDRFNLQRSDMEEQLALQNALSYEDRMFRTQAAYDANLREYYNYMRDLNLARFNDVRNQNMVNSLFENYEVNPDGSISVKPDSERFFEIQALLGNNEDKKKKDKNKTENSLKIKKPN